MKAKALFIALAIASAPAYATDCVKAMTKIDAAVSTAKLEWRGIGSHPGRRYTSTSPLEEVKKHRADGEAMHKAGKHQDSVDTLARAMKILGIK